LVATFVAVALGGIAVLGAISYFRLWGYLWREWVTTIDHKRIGIMYMILGLIMLLRGFADALMMRWQQAVAFGGAEGFLPAHHYDQVFTAHGVIMIFFMAMPFITGLMNFVVPLQIGARDVSFPFLNNFSFWMTAMGAALVMVSLFVGEFARTGWLAYPPLSGIAYSPDVGVDYYIWALQIAGVGTLLSGVNLIATIVKLRAPGMTMMRMPIFTWTALCTNVLIVAAFPILTVTLALLSLDRYVGTNFFTNDGGGNPMMYINLIWIWGHPEVYILILPIFGVFSEVTATFSGKRLFGYTSMVYATVVITILSYLVWLHHFFTMGSGASVNSFFGITTMIISIPTGAKMFNWLFTLYRGRIRFELPMLWTLAFMLTFVIGGMSGVLLAVPPADFVLHNSLFLVAHFHNVIIGGVVFGVFAGITYWFPKAFGFRLDPFWGKMSFWFWVTGFYLAFMPLYVLGLMGVTRRLRHFEDPSLQVWFVIAAIGAVLVLFGIVSFLVQIYVSIRRRETLRDLSGDPWGGRTLEWSTASPPPDYNFAFTPIVHDNDAWWDMKQRGFVRPVAGFNAITMPRNTGAGFILAALCGVFGFAMIWHIWWLAALGFVTVLARRLHIPSTTSASSRSRRPKSAASRTGGRACWACEREAMEVTAGGGDVAAEVPVFCQTEEHSHAGGGSTLLGFWIYLMSDCLLFAALFATYGVLGGSYAGGPSPRELFELPLVAVNTTMLLLSSITYGFAMLADLQGSRARDAGLARRHRVVRTRVRRYRTL
jgi:cytochrome o ubiquinol oxidase subunit I